MDKNTKNCLLSVEEMYMADQMTIENGTSGLELMEAAGRAIYQAIFTHHNPQHALILCGPGNNGGDGFVVGRLLKERGVQVTLLLLGSQDHLTGDAKTNADRYDGTILPFSHDNLCPSDLVIDAIFGAGLSRDIDGTVKGIIEHINKMNAFKVAVDVPSGIDGNTGAIRGCAFNADLSVTFCRPKIGHYLYPAKRLIGELVIADIGIKDRTIEDISPKVSLNDPAHLYPWPDKEGHKYDRGHAVIIGGTLMTGASKLAAMCARRVGAGLLTIHCEEEAQLTYSLSSPGNMISSAALEELIRNPKMNGFLIGPGLGVDKKGAQKLDMLLKSEKSLILDADALTLISQKETYVPRHAPTIMTPHEGEFNRLFPDISGSKVERARKAAEITNAIIILKGPDTVIASPNGQCVINTTGTAWLATAGSGDSLAGICLGLLCQKMDEFEAACLAVWLHGRCAELIGEGLIAEDIQAFLPKVLKTLKK